MYDEWRRETDPYTFPELKDNPDMEMEL
jgi:hypothetical protein